jgi:hypothetical protein
MPADLQIFHTKNRFLTGGWSSRLQPGSVLSSLRLFLTPAGQIYERPIKSNLPVTGFHMIFKMAVPRSAAICCKLFAAIFKRKLLPSNCAHADRLFLPPVSGRRARTARINKLLF